MMMKIKICMARDSFGLHVLNQLNELSCTLTTTHYSFDLIRMTDMDCLYLHIYIYLHLWLRIIKIQCLHLLRPCPSPAFVRMKSIEEALCLQSLVSEESKQCEAHVSLFSITGLSDFSDSKNSQLSTHERD